jgi:hypothetical protein
MSISIIHPSRNRPEMAISVAEKWIENSSKEIKLEYILSIDTDEPKLEKYKELFSSDRYVILENNNKTAIEAINNAAIKTKNNLIIVVSDDFDCFPNWDKWLIEKLEGKKDFIVKTTDGIQEYLITLPIMDREYYNRFGYIYYPEYKHMFCDTEMTDVGTLLGKVIDLRDQDHKFIHKHYTAGFMEKDEINEKNDSTWNQGEQLYYSRKENNFFL